MLLSFFLAILAAVSNAASNVLQRKANKEEPPELSLSPRLIVDLLHRKAWLAGLGTVTLSFLLQAAALGNGELAIVQPIIVLELPLTLIAASVVFHASMGRREWGATALMTAGLAGLIGALFPRGGSARTGAATWVVGIGASLALIAVLVLAGRRMRDARRAALLGCATGISFGLTAALMKGTTAAFSSGIVGVLTAWQAYGMVAAGILGMFLMQSALQAGKLVAAQPGITLLDPFTAILWGVIGFGEHARGGLFIILAVVAGAGMVAGALVLSGSNLLQEEAEAPAPATD